MEIFSERSVLLLFLLIAFGAARQFALGDEKMRARRKNEWV